MGSLADERGNPHFAATSTRAKEERLGVLDLVCTWNRINLKATWTCGLAHSRFGRRKDIGARDAVAEGSRKGETELGLEAAVLPHQGLSIIRSVFLSGHGAPVSPHQY